MKQSMLVLCLLAALGFGQSSFDLVKLPTDSRDASLGLPLSPIVKPSQIWLQQDPQVSLSAWSWVADINGAYVGIGLENSYFSIQSQSYGELEYRNEIPSDEPLSVFGYSVFALGAAHVYEWNDFLLGAGTEILYERTLDTANAGIAVNFEVARTLSSNLMLSTGVRHLGSGGKLGDERTSFPVEVWLAADAHLGNSRLLMEVNDGDFPFTLGASYQFAHVVDFMGGVQSEMTESGLRVHPSVGFTASYDQFSLGYSLYQFSHNLGPRHFLSLFWRY